MTDLFIYLGLQHVDDCLPCTYYMTDICVDYGTVWMMALIVSDVVPDDGPITAADGLPCG